MAIHYRSVGRFSSSSFILSGYELYSASSIDQSVIDSGHLATSVYINVFLASDLSFKRASEVIFSLYSGVNEPLYINESFPDLS